MSPFKIILKCLGLIWITSFLLIWQVRGGNGEEEGGSDGVTKKRITSPTNNLNNNNTNNSTNNKQSEKNESLPPIIQIGIDFGQEGNLSLIRGKVLKSRSGKQYFAYLGIPYAKPPQRFKAAEPVESWDGIRDCTQFGSECIQLQFDSRVRGSEDCLFLNVYTAKINSNNTVLVFIHGGAFMFGSSNEYGAKYFMDEDVVLVTINYRVGAFGFLSTDDEVVQGNMGLKDQVLALRWVQENIKFFGGDPNSVTIFGGSAGAASVAYHVLSPMSTGLFHRGIMQSGSALCPWALRHNPRVFADKLAELTNCFNNDSSIMTDCLRNLDAETIVKKNFTEWFWEPLAVFVPNVEKMSSNSSEVFLSKSPLQIYQDGEINKVPIILGVNEDEGLLLHAFSILGSEAHRQEMNQDWNRVAPLHFMYYENETIPNRSSDNISSAIRNFYFEENEIGNETVQSLTNLYSDRQFVHGVKTTAVYHSNYDAVYPYIFTYRGELSSRRYLALGVGHGDEIQYLFDSEEYELQPGSQAEELSKAFVKMWVNFAATGNPGHDDWQSVQPSETRSKSLKWFSVNDNPTLVPEPFESRMEFWDEMTQNYVRAKPPKVEL